MEEGAPAAPAVTGADHYERPANAGVKAIK
jgi:hypothetical protein